METTERILQRRDPGSLEAHLGYCLRRVSNHVSSTFARLLREQGTSTAEWVVLRLLDQGAAKGPSELAEALSLTRGAMSKILAKLEAKGWVAREVREDDNRAQWVSLTSAGRAVVPKLAELADRNDEEQFQALSETERAKLRRLLLKLTEFHQIRDVAVE